MTNDEGRMANAYSTFAIRHSSLPPRLAFAATAAAAVSSAAAVATAAAIESTAATATAAPATTPESAFALRPGFDDPQRPNFHL
jgi:hypothetical protein